MTTGPVKALLSWSIILMHPLDLTCFISSRGAHKRGVLERVRETVRSAYFAALQNEGGGDVL